MSSFASSIYFTILAKFQTMIYINKKKKNGQIKLKKTNKQTHYHRKANTKNNEHNALYNPKK